MRSPTAPGSQLHPRAVSATRAVVHIVRRPRGSIGWPEIPPGPAHRAGKPPFPSRRFAPSERGPSRESARGSRASVLSSTLRRPPMPPARGICRPRPPRWPGRDGLLTRRPRQRNTGTQEHPIADADADPGCGGAWVDREDGREVVVKVGGSRCGSCWPSCVLRSSDREHREASRCHRSGRHAGKAERSRPTLGLSLHAPRTCTRGSMRAKEESR